MLTAFAKNEVALLAPDHVRYEVANAIRTALRRGRLDPVNARLAVDNFLAMDVTLVAGNDLLIAAYDFAIRLDCSYYDALYLALSSTSSCPFIHADRRLHNTLAGRFEHELWIEDYSTAS